MLNRIRIVLIATSHPGNIGSAARAMKTMGLSRLYLVSPKKYPHSNALELAAGAENILEQAIVVESLSQALEGCRLVVGTSARPRGMSLPGLNPRECGERVIAVAQQGDVAIVFGREHAGMTNDELLHCQFHTMIPANPDYSSLNLAAAVQVLCYECRMASGATINVSMVEDQLASHDEVESFYKHLNTTLRTLKVIKPQAPKRILPRLQRLLNRVQLEKREVRLLHGILSAMDKM